MKENSINRRSYMAALTAAGGTTIAGCLGGDDSDGDSDDDSDDGTGDDAAEHGERVPTVELESMTGVSGAANIESTMQHVMEAVEELGADADVAVKEFVTMLDELNNDSRDRHFHLDITPSFPSLLDPSLLVQPFLVHQAGANGLSNSTQYASCEFTERFLEQDQASGEERQELVNEMASVWSEDIHTINVHPQVGFGAYRSDQIEPPGGDTGVMGVTDRNVDLMVQSQGIDGEDKHMNVSDTVLQDSTYMANLPVSAWSNTVFSSLVYYDINNEIQPHLATDWEIEGNEVFTYHLREDATFHNGEPVTAEDVKFTFEHVQRNTHIYDAAEEQPYESIEAVDDHTVEFTLETPSASFHTAWVPQWGIAPRDEWIEGGAEENPEDIDDEQALIGSGPYEVETWRRGELMQMVPVEDHWHDPQGRLVMEVYHDNTSALRAFEEGTVNILTNISGSDTEMLDEELPDVVETVATSNWTSWWVLPQMSFGPSKFREFRHALSQALDRRFISEVLEHGEAEPSLYSEPFPENHPFYPDNPDEVLTQIADDPTGDVERAREILEDAGWTWDDDGRLHYPADADLEPLWPEGSEPREHPDEFPCIEELGL